jgi:molybdopterin synthase catalytic subunit
MDTDALPGNQDFVEVSHRPIDPGSLVSSVVRDDTGAVVVFLGTVRDHSEGRVGVTGLDYEAYEGVVEETISAIVAEARARWDLGSVSAVHRVGRLAVGEVSVGVAVSAPHRPEAFDAARFLIDQLKARAPIWKKELWAEGEEWV